MIDEIGIVVEGDTPTTVKTLGKLYLDEFRVFGKADYSIDLAKQKKELATVTPFAVNHGAWEIENDRLGLMCCEESLAYTGNYYAKDMRVQAEVELENGDFPVLLLRARGAKQSYMAGFRDGNVCIWRQDFGLEELARAPFPVEYGRAYQLTFQAVGDTLSVDVDGVNVLQVQDSTFTSGMVGLGACSMGRTFFGKLHIQEL